MDLFALDPIENEIVDGIARPTRTLNFREFGLVRREQRPVALLYGALLDPAADQIDLAVLQPVVPRVGGWHAKSRIF